MLDNIIIPGNPLGTPNQAESPFYVSMAHCTCILPIIVKMSLPPQLECKLLEAGGHPMHHLFILVPK